VRQSGLKYYRYSWCLPNHTFHTKTINKHLEASSDRKSMDITDTKDRTDTWKCSRLQLSLSLFLRQVSAPNARFAKHGKVGRSQINRMRKNKMSSNQKHES